MKILAFAILSAISIHMDDSDEVLVEDIEDTPLVKLPVQTHMIQDHERNEESKSKIVPKIIRKYQNIKDINRYQIISMESLNLIKEFQDITDASTFADGNVMMELHRKSDEIHKLASDLQVEFQKMSPTEQRGFMEEYKQLLFNSLPQRLRHFKELSASHLSLHRRVMESTLDVLRQDRHSPLVDYIQSRLRHSQFSSESKLREMLRIQQKKRNKWIFGITRLEWIMLTAQVWLLSIAFSCIWKTLNSFKIRPKGFFKHGWIFNLAHFSVVFGLVHVELSKCFIDWSFLKTRTLGISLIQFVIIGMIRELRHVLSTFLTSSKKIGKSSAQK